MSGPRLVEQVHARLGKALGEGDLALDGTLGNGHDLCFLAEGVGESGHVYGFDVQTEAIEASRSRLQAAGLASRATLFVAGHETLSQYLPLGVTGQLAVAMFNLGYLPGSDKRTVTRTDTTLIALTAALAALRPAGLLSVVAYPGHDGGGDETSAVRDWAHRQAAAGCGLNIHVPEHRRGPAPHWYLITAPG
ncbi:MAG: methyltransferase domain-containing protein [Gammaproteobacteria bacterium]|nr:methyltransferase domain-containing protein [Gammaproteobacteria bacterium]